MLVIAPRSALKPQEFAVFSLRNGSYAALRLLYALSYGDSQPILDFKFDHLRYPYNIAKAPAIQNLFNPILPSSFFFRGLP